MTNKKNIKIVKNMERKEAIDVVKEHLYKCSFNLHHSSFTMLREALETLIPELKENEDERIRKELIKGFQHYDKECKWGEFTTTEVLAWLEKQGVQQPYKGNGDTMRKNLIKAFKSVGSNHWGGLDVRDIIHFLESKDDIELEKQGEYSDFCNKIQIGDKVTRNKDGLLVNLSQLERVAKTNEKNTNEKNTNEKNTNEKKALELAGLKQIDEDERYYNHSGCEIYDKCLEMAKWKDEQINNKLIALAMWMNERGFFRDDLCCDIEHQVMTFVELQNRKSEKGELDVCDVKNENRKMSNNPDEEMAKAIAHNDSLYDEENQSVSEQCEISAMKMAEWKNEQFDKKLRGYFWEHIVPNGKYNLEIADDFIKFDKEKRKAVDEIIKQFNEFNAE